MSFEDIKSAVARMSMEEQRRLVAYLVQLQDARDPAVRAELAGRIDDKDPEHWVSLEQLRKQWKK